VTFVAVGITNVTLLTLSHHGRNVCRAWSNKRNNYGRRHSPM